MAVIDELKQARQSGRKLMSILIDPEKTTHVRQLDFQCADMVLVGGSTGSGTREAVRLIRECTSLPIVLFPGCADQLCDDADAVLLLSLLSSRDAEWLIGQQVKSARWLHSSGLECIPTAYILIDGGRKSSVERRTGSNPMAHDAIDEVVSTALAAQLMGMQAVYLEAGSGALNPVSEEMIRSVREVLDIPLIVGGGLRARSSALRAWEAGADMIVVGNFLEENPSSCNQFNR